MCDPRRRRQWVDQAGERLLGIECREIIHQIASVMTSSLDIDGVFDRFAAELSELVDFDRIAVLELDETKEHAVRTFVSCSAAFDTVPSQPVPLEATAIGWVVGHRRTRVERDLRQHTELDSEKSLHDAGFQSVLRTPLVTGNGAIGVLELCSLQRSAFDESAQAVAEEIAIQIAPAVENARLYQRAQAHARELEIIDNVATIVSSSLRTEEVYERFASELKRLVDYDSIAIVRVDEGAQEAVCEYSTYPILGQLKAGHRWALEEDAVGSVAEQRRSPNGPYVDQEKLLPIDDALLDVDAGSVIRVPLVSEGRNIGVFALYSRKRDSFGDSEQRVLERLAAQIAPAIENARLYEEVQQALETLRSTQQHMVQVERLRAMGELASGVAHDFNNALAAILGQTQLLMTRVTYEPHLKSLQFIAKAALESAQVVRRILDFARLDSEPQFSSVDVNRLVDDVVELTRHKWRDEAQSKGRTIQVETHLGANLLALGNHSELTEVLTNLVINACEAISGDGAIEIRASGSQGQVRISVSDTGVGMGRETMRKAFDPFFTTKGFSGTGLGLSVALGMITRHNGAIDLDSEEGAGTTVTITLAAASPVEDTSGPDAEFDAESSRAATILVIEDDPLIRETIADMLSLEDHKVTLAANGEEGISLFKEGKYDIVFTDLGMLGLTGWEVAKAIKGHRSGVPVILVTGWGAGVAQVGIDRNTVDEILPKPFDMDELLRLVSELMKVES